jgi:hypothetical protein
MKNWLYIPFLVLMAVTYSRLVENYNDEIRLNNIMSRGPASVEVEIFEECKNSAAIFNPHYNLKNCFSN